jgi:hypothetical protein
VLKKGTSVFIFDTFKSNPELRRQLAKRIAEFPGSDKAHARQVMGRLTGCDPSLLVMVAVRNGLLVAHTVNQVEGDTLQQYQCLVDPGFPRVLDIFLSLADTWVMQKGITRFRAEINQHTPEIWTSNYKRYGFAVTSYNIERKVR